MAEKISKKKKDMNGDALNVKDAATGKTEMKVPVRNVAEPVKNIADMEAAEIIEKSSEDNAVGDVVVEKFPVDNAAEKKVTDNVSEGKVSEGKVSEGKVAQGNVAIEKAAGNNDVENNASGEKVANGDGDEERPASKRNKAKLVRQEKNGKNGKSDISELSNTEKLINKDMKIGDLIRKYPASAVVMIEYGLHCIGCHVAEWETLEQGALAHGLNHEEIEKMVEKINSQEIVDHNSAAKNGVQKSGYQKSAAHNSEEKGTVESDAADDMNKSGTESVNDDSEPEQAKGQGLGGLRRALFRR